MKGCDKCSCSGIYIGWGGPVVITTGSISGGAIATDCKYCNGKGYIDDEEIISVPRKYVKDEYFND